ncbi:MAG TPA: pilus assembly PilX N-terminal domain-containing protein [Candidatus Acidoferrum sp.]|nr:pilus assembly PilX N-terminal domain-containing protein [Candidatus Acidoferrum sp.]
MKYRTISGVHLPGDVPAPGNQSGIALIVAILGLLLVTSVAAAMILLSTSETTIDANYRDQQVALFAAKAGLEEARDRMLSSNANPLTVPTILPGGSGVYAAYITAPGISPWSDTDLVNGVSTYDQEFAKEMGVASLPGGTWYTDYPTNSNYSGPASNPLPYQWVRINLKTDGSAYTSGTPYYVDGNPANANKQVCWDTLNEHEVVISSAGCQVASSTYANVYEITSLAVTPSGARRMVQDEVASINFDLDLNSPLTIPGTVGSFQGAASANYRINGADGSGGAPAVSGCTPNTAGGPAVAVSSSGNANTVIYGNNVSGTQETGTNCTYSSGGQACVGGASLPESAATPAELNQTLQEIEQNATACLGCTASGPGTYSYSDVVAALGGSWTSPATNPQVVYVNGNLDISSSTGSGTLVVTGDLTYDGNSSWNGIVLVVGQGATIYKVSGAGTGEFNGAMLVATTEDASGNLLTNFGVADFNIHGAGGNGVYYNSCWVNNVQKPIVFELLSSKEISY